MKKVAIITILLISGFVANAQNKETRKLSSFSELSVGLAIVAYISAGDKEEVQIEARGIDLDDVETNISGGKLKINLDGNSNKNVDVTVWVTYKSLNAVSVSTAAELYGENEVRTSGDFTLGVFTGGEAELEISAKVLDIRVATSGHATLDANVSSINASLSTGGSVRVKGSCKTQNIKVSTSGDYFASDLSSEWAEISAYTGGGVKVTVTESIDASAKTGGWIHYAGNPEKYNVSTNTGGSIKKQ